MRAVEEIDNGGYDFSDIGDAEDIIRDNLERGIIIAEEMGFDTLSQLLGLALEELNAAEGNEKILSLIKQDVVFN